jgi:hypothetical protein
VRSAASLTPCNTSPEDVTADHLKDGITNSKPAAALPGPTAAVYL